MALSEWYQVYKSLPLSPVSSSAPRPPGRRADWGSRSWRSSPTWDSSSCSCSSWLCWAADCSPVCSPGRCSAGPAPCCRSRWPRSPHSALLLLPFSSYSSWRGSRELRQRWGRLGGRRWRYRPSWRDWLAYSLVPARDILTSTSSVWASVPEDWSQKVFPALLPSARDSWRPPPAGLWVCSWQFWRKSCLTCSTLYPGAPCLPSPRPEIIKCMTSWHAMTEWLILWQNKWLT